MDFTANTDSLDGDFKALLKMRQQKKERTEQDVKVSVSGE